MNNRGVILIVEDDEAIRDSLKEMLIDEGYCVRTANDGAQALKDLQTQEAPELILLDLMMPNVDGYQFRDDQMRADLCLDVPIVVMSAHANVRTEFEKIGGKSFLKKPLDVEKVLTVVQNFVGKK